ncbi:hypothetical protein LIA77_09649 [Sarocladium implicatum]|nr:hypothetical protein LIA77_09649 [Sarocladium implicatum]
MLFSVENILQFVSSHSLTRGVFVDILSCLMPYPRLLASHMQVCPSPSRNMNPPKEKTRQETNPHPNNQVTADHVPRELDATPKHPNILLPVPSSSNPPGRQDSAAYRPIRQCLRTLKGAT